jgi:hypothetical protein
MSGTKNKSAKATVHHAVSSAHSYIDAFNATASDRAALTLERLLSINLDVQTIVPMLLGLAPVLAEHRTAIAAELPGFDLATFDAIVLRVEALAHAQTLYLSASQPVEPLPKLMEEAIPLRDQLLSDATTLARRGLIDGKRLADLKGGPGYLNIGSDLSVLAQMLRERWTDIDGKCAVRASEIDAAEGFYQRINAAYGERAVNPGAAAKAADDRQRAYTLVYQAYDEARRAIQYIRWHQGDAEKIAPSLYTTRRRPVTASGADAGGDGSTTSPPPPVATPTPPAVHEPPAARGANGAASA